MPKCCLWVHFRTMPRVLSAAEPEKRLGILWTHCLSSTVLSSLRKDSDRVSVCRRRSKGRAFQTYHWKGSILQLQYERTKPGELPFPYSIGDDVLGYPKSDSIALGGKLGEALAWWCRHTRAATLYSICLRIGSQWWIAGSSLYDKKIVKTPRK